jgi:GNAT superfamily N-acetyltransferase
MVAESMSNVIWPKPLPLEGVKSRKRAIFSVPKAYFKSNGPRSMNTVSGLELTLESRVAAVGERVVQAATDLLLGNRKIVTGTLARHDSLRVVHLGPHLLSTSEPSFDQFLAAVNSALEEQPQAVVLEEAASSNCKAWGSVFQAILRDPGLKSFRGAVVIGTSRDTLAAVEQICTGRWTGAGEWLWQDTMKEKEHGLEYIEDVLSEPDSGSLNQSFLQEVRELAWAEPFNEDLIEIARSRGWNLTLLTTTASSSQCCKSDSGQEPEKDCNGRKALGGFVCYKVRSGTMVITRLAVSESLRTSGYGRQLMQFVLDKAAQLPRSEAAWIAVSSVDTAVPFYERFGFVDMTDDDIEDAEHFQTWMEMPNASTVPEDAL